MGAQLVFKNGIYYIAVTSGAKGGRYRESPIISNIDAIVKRMKEAGNGKVWSYVPDMDVTRNKVLKTINCSVELNFI